MISPSIITLPYDLFDEWVTRYRCHKKTRRTAKIESEKKRRIDELKSKFEAIAAEERSHFLDSDETLVYKEVEDDAILVLRKFCNLKKDEEDRRMDEEDRRMGRNIYPCNDGIEVRIVSRHYNLTLISVSFRLHKRNWKRWQTGCLLP